MARITFYNSFEDQKEDEYRYLASLTGVEHLANAIALIKRVYAKQLAEIASKPRNNRIKIISNG